MCIHSGISVALITPHRYMIPSIYDDTDPLNEIPLMWLYLPQFRSPSVMVIRKWSAIVLITCPVYYHWGSPSYAGLDLDTILRTHRHTVIPVSYLLPSSALWWYKTLVVVADVASSSCLRVCLVFRHFQFWCFPPAKWHALSYQSNTKVFGLTHRVCYHIFWHTNGMISLAGCIVFISSLFTWVSSLVNQKYFVG